MLKAQYDCPHFRILVIGRANAGKTTILEKVCGVDQGTTPVIYDENGVELKAPKPGVRLLAPIKQIFNLTPLLAPSGTHLTPSMQVSFIHMDLCSLICNYFQKGIHNIEHQITYPGSNFIFHDSEGFESGASRGIETVWKFIQKRSTAIELRGQLHAIWYVFIGSLKYWMTTIWFS